MRSQLPSGSYPQADVRTIVIGLEPVDIDEQQRQRLLLPAGAPPLSLQRLIEDTTVGEPGQAVRAGLNGELVVCDRELILGSLGRADIMDVEDGMCFISDRIGDEAKVRLGPTGRSSTAYASVCAPESAGCRHATTTITSG